MSLRDAGGAGFRAAAEGIASALGDGWSAVCDDEPVSEFSTLEAHLHGPDRIVLRAQLSPAWAGQERWYIDGVLTPEETAVRPASYDSSAAPCPQDITMSAGKTAEQLAADIRRRYLDAWTAHVAATRARLRLRDDRRARVIAAGDALIGAFDGRAAWQTPGPTGVGPGELDPARHRVIVHPDADVMGSVVIHDAKPPDTLRATIELTGPVDLALALADYLATRYPQ